MEKIQIKRNFRQGSMGVCIMGTVNRLNLKVIENISLMQHVQEKNFLSFLYSSSRTQDNLLYASASSFQPNNVKIYFFFCV